MGIIDKGAGAALGAVGLGSITNRKVTPKGFTADFPNGLRIVEVVNGRELNVDAIQLVGAFMPLIPFKFGGTQQIIKDYYPGNSEPVVQVLGPKEDDVTIRGKFKTKRFKDATLEGAAQEYQELVDAMRIRGNLVKITLGEWRRYGFIGAANFELNRLCDIAYEITFSIVGFNAPKNCKIIDGADDDLIRPNKNVTNAAAKALAAARNYPATMPRTISEFMNEMIGEVAGAINLVTSFVDGALSDIENITASANRAVGLIKNARATVSRTSRRIGALQLSLANLTVGVSGSSFKTAAQFNNAHHIKSTMTSFAALAALLAALQLRFAGLTRTVPLSRHLVKTGDTLQRLAIKYYNDANNWKSIYDHNKLTSPTLVVGSVLEIPRL